jgi:hypothetical protein
MDGLVPPGPDPFEERTCDLLEVEYLRKERREEGEAFALCSIDRFRPSSNCPMFAALSMSPGDRRDNQNSGI